MKKIIFLSTFIMAGLTLKAQIAYDSLAISRFLIKEEMYGANWKDTLKAGHYSNYIADERTVWVKPVQVYKVLPPIISIVNRVKTNGTADVAKCFIPRHSINYYKGGKIVKYLLICFECDGLRFSDDSNNTFVKSADVREKQMAELKEVFKNLL
ncbi:MAG: hypothetical protein HOP10_00045 [Chitinophagaceae bacterium]|nr:hypothetical protein [Chitinophagaceae bacterium]